MKSRCVAIFVRALKWESCQTIDLCTLRTLRSITKSLMAKLSERHSHRALKRKWSEKQVELASAKKELEERMGAYRARVESGGDFQRQEEKRASAG